MKRALIFLFCLFFSTINSFPQYWKKINNLPFQYANNYWLDVYFHPQNSNYGWICGFNGMVIYTTDGGNSWRGTVIPNAYHLESIHFPTLAIGYTSGVDGIFKSTDGGASWFDITPDGTRDTTTFWGCFFLDANYGILVGDGCGTGRRQHFWITSDGGNTWSVFLGSENNTGMTDAILFPNGIGFASSSGKIWHTLDSGRTWSVLSNVGPSLWQEEITNHGNSFLVPYSGFSCTGAGNDGGMYFSTDYGYSWNRTQTGVPMFGTFLISNLKGWACGYSQAVFYTSNGGLTWARRNCGIHSGNLDDLWFISESDGWVVGEGVYKLSSPVGIVSPNSVSFGNVCIEDKSFDTIWFSNYNFNDATISLSLNPPNSDFKIESPGISGFVQSCDSLMIIVSFSPKTTGNVSALLNISSNYQAPITVELSGNGFKSTAHLVDTILTISDVPCGQTIEAFARVIAENSDEEVKSVQKISGGSGINIAITPPFRVYQDRPNNIKVNIVLYDTGWQVARFRINYSPCNKEEILTVRAYGKSPIIQTDSNIHRSYFCKIDTILLAVHNNGNVTLQITNFTFNPKSPLLSIGGWKSGIPLSESHIKPNSNDTLILIIAPNFEGILETKLILSNNDFTTSRGLKNNLTIPIKIEVFIPKLYLSDTLFDFGKICINDSISKKCVVYNLGNLDENINSIFKKLKEFNITSNRIFPFSVPLKDSTTFIVSFKPIRSGYFYDTIKLTTQNCPDTLMLYCRGQAVSHQVDFSPKLIDANQPLGKTQDYYVKIWTLIPDTLNISQIKILYDSTNLSVQIQPKNSLITFIDTGLIQFSIYGKKPGKFTITIFVTINGVCNQELQIQLVLFIYDKNLVIKPPSFDFGNFICNPKDSSFKIQIFNGGFEPDTIESIHLVQKYSQFAINANLSEPLIIPQNTEYDFEVIYSPKNLGFDTAFVLFNFTDSSRNISMPVYAFWGKSNIMVQPAIVNFGSLEYCESSIDTLVQLWNKGNITDTIEVIKDFSNHCFFYRFSNYTIGSNDSIYLIISLNPSNNYFGNLIDTLLLRTKICNQIIPIVVSSEIIIPKYEITPNFIELGEMWIGDTLHFQVECFNNSSSELEFHFDGLTTPSLNFTFDSTQVVLLPPKSKSTFFFKIIARVSGNFSDTLIFTIKSECSYNIATIVHYLIPVEEYELFIRIGKYVFPPGENEAVEIINETPNPKLRLDSLNLLINYDKFLFLINECVSSLGSENIIAFNDLNGTIVKLAGKPLEDFLKKSSTILCRGNTFYSAPDTTSLDLVNVRFFPKKQINLKLENGFLRISPICRPIGSLRLSTMPYFELLDKKINNRRIKIEVSSNEAQELCFSIYSLIGNPILSFTKTINSGISNLLLEVPNEIASGVIIFRVTNYHQTYSFIIPIY
ncbi:MAG: hypothetical protein ACUVQ1_08685 [Candidatus Kapaibacteriales bacterium]